MHSSASKVVVLISHLQRPRQRSRLAQVVSGLTADYPDTRIEAVSYTHLTLPTILLV